MFKKDKAMKCPRCGLPPEGETECHYCGLKLEKIVKDFSTKKLIQGQKNMSLLKQSITLVGVLILVFVFLYFHIQNEVAKREIQRIETREKQRVEALKKQITQQKSERRKAERKRTAINRKGTETKRKPLQIDRIPTTKGNQIACFKESDYDDIIKFIAVDDVASGQVYIDSKRCFILKKGIKVTIMEYPGIFGGKVQCAYAGTKFWTAREAIDFK